LAERPLGESASEFFLGQIKIGNLAPFVFCKFAVMILRFVSL
jgi:hypothetical protein